MKVAVGFEKHSPMLGQRADSHTVCRPRERSMDFNSWSRLAGPSRFFAQGGSRFIFEMVVNILSD